MSSSETWQRPEATLPPAEPTGESVQIKVQAADAFTEIRVLDAHFQPITLPTNTGAVEVDVAPGLYEVGFRTADGWESHHVIATSAAPPAPIVQQPSPSLHGVAPVPLPVAVPNPDGATVTFSLFAGLAMPAVPDAANIEVQLINADNGATISPDLVPGSASAWRFAAQPGFWRLRINEAIDRQPFEMPLTVVPEYVTHVSAQLAKMDTGRCIDLERLRIRMLRPECWAAMTPELVEYEEAALAALSSSRPLFGPQIEALIDNLATDKFLNPMLGIFAAHLCDGSRDEQVSFRDRLQLKLESITQLAGGNVHPDVAALRLGLCLRTGQPVDQAPPILFPPVLAASWRVLFEASKLNPALIPAGSLCERVADRLWSSSLWVAWTAPPLQADTPPASLTAASFALAAGQAMAMAAGPMANPAAAGAAVAVCLAHPEVREWFRKSQADTRSSREGVEWESPTNITPAEAAVATAIFPVAPEEERQEQFTRLAEALSRGKISDRKVESIKKMADSLGLPRATVERALNSLAGKLIDEASKFNIEI